MSTQNWRLKELHKRLDDLIWAEKTEQKELAAKY